MKMKSDASTKITPAVGSLAAKAPQIITDIPIEMSSPQHGEKNSLGKQ